MVLEELVSAGFVRIERIDGADKYILADNVAGPIIKSEVTSLPYRGNRFGEGWRNDRGTAGLPTTVWARDLRASGITEARAAGVAMEDAGKVAGHASTKTTSAIYDRAVLEAAERFADARVKLRKSRKV
jgi:hypothetical protein